MVTDNLDEQPRTEVRELELEMMSNADKISAETIVSILDKKGVLTREELHKLEKKIDKQSDDHTLVNNSTGNHQKQPEKEASFIKINNPYDRGKFPGLKRAMSKHRWTRKVGSMLFGWKWRKIKKTSAQ